jgi:hypothetical protein
MGLHQVVYGISPRLFVPVPVSGTVLQNCHGCEDVFRRALTYKGQIEETDARDEVVMCEWIQIMDYVPKRK